jgi:uncharacterized membrane protein
MEKFEKLVAEIIIVISLLLIFIPATGIILKPILAIIAYVLVIRILIKNRKTNKEGIKK